MTCRAVAITVFALGLLSGPAFAGNFDFSGWSAALGDHVSKGIKEGVPVNLVDYSAMAKDKRFQQTISSLTTHHPSLTDVKSKIAFWTNVYNILAIKVVIDNPGVKSIRDVGSFFSSVWKKVAGKVGGWKRLYAGPYRT